MTVFTKKDDTEKKETTEKEVPKVIVSGSLSPKPSDEQDISNAGWVPMEGGNFDRPKEKRSSSFGPLSIIRLSPSPLARTPSPTPPEYENYENSRTRCCTKLVFILCLLVGFGFGTGMFFYQRGLIRSAYQRGVYHGWTQATYNNNGVAERLEQNSEISPEENYEKLEVPRFGSNRPAVFLHDFKRNLTAIVDVMGKRCFVKKLDRSTVAPPKNLIEVLRGMESTMSSNPVAPRVVRETFRVGQPLPNSDIEALNSFIISRHCEFRPVYMLQKVEEQTQQRVKRASEPIFDQLDFASLGSDSVELDTIIL